MFFISRLLKSRTDLKGLWKVLNSIDRKKNYVSNNVTLEQFVEYFKNLNELPENEKDQEIVLLMRSLIISS
jgi:hypothetical protein